MWAMSRFMGTHQEKEKRASSSPLTQNLYWEPTDTWLVTATPNHSSFPGVFSVKPLPNPIHSAAALTTVLSQYHKSRRPIQASWPRREYSQDRRAELDLDLNPAALLCPPVAVPPLIWTSPASRVAPPQAESAHQCKWKMRDSLV